MNASYRIKAQILGEVFFDADAGYTPEFHNEAQIDDQISELTSRQLDHYQEVEQELRECGVRSSLGSVDMPWELVKLTRHYEDEERALLLKDGTWVGYTYWSGGGKHGEPECIEWVEYAYDLETWEELEPVRKFRRVDS